MTMSWFEETKRTFLESLAIKVIRCGPIPKHVAFIMDGNRRYASKNRLNDVVMGHSHGFDQLTKVCTRISLVDGELTHVVADIRMVQ